MNKVLVILAVVIVIAGCTSGGGIKGKHQVDVGMCAVIQTSMGLLPEPSKSVDMPDTIVTIEPVRVSVYETGSAVIKVGGVEGSAAALLGKEGINQLISLIDKAVQWTAVARKESVELINKPVGHVSFDGGVVAVSVNVNDAGAIYGLEIYNAWVDYGQMALEGLHGKPAYAKMTDQRSLKMKSVIAYVNGGGFRCFKEKLANIPEYTRKAGKAASKEHLFK